MHQYRLGVKWVENIFEEKELGDLLKSRLNTSQQCALSAKRASRILGSANKSTASRSAAAVICSEPGETTSRVLCPVLDIRE